MALGDVSTQTMMPRSNVCTALATLRVTGGEPTGQPICTGKFGSLMTICPKPPVGKNWQTEIGTGEARILPDAGVTVGKLTGVG